MQEAKLNTKYNLKWYLSIPSGFTSGLWEPYKENTDELSECETFGKARHYLKHVGSPLVTYKGYLFFLKQLRKNETLTRFFVLWEQINFWFLLTTPGLNGGSGAATEQWIFFMKGSWWEVCITGLAVSMCENGGGGKRSRRRLGSRLLTSELSATSVPGSFQRKGKA